MPTLTITNLPNELHARLKDQAQKHHRSLNQEAIHCIEVAVQMGHQAATNAQAPAPDTERAEWLALSERNLTETWDNTADDVFNELLTK